MLREVNFKVSGKLLRKKKLKSITIDIDSSVVNVEGHQEGAVRGYHPKKLGNNCYNIQFTFCDEIKGFITGMIRSGDTYTANGAAEMIKEIMAYLKNEGVEITFRMGSGYFDDTILETIESYGAVLTDRGTEYCGALEHYEFELYLAIEDIDHTKTRARHPQSNGICERFHKIIQEEFYAVAAIDRANMYQA